MLNLINKTLFGLIFFVASCDSIDHKGQFLLFHSKLNGIVTTRGMLINEKKEGLWLTYSLDSRLLKEEYYLNNNLLKMIEHKKSSPPNANVYIETKIDSYSNNSYIEIRDTFLNRPKGLLINSKRIGLWIDYEEDGSLAVESCYFQNQLEGETIAYSNQNSILFRTNYHKGLENGPFEQFHDNGRLYRCGQYKQGKMFGVWKYFMPYGRLHKKIKYRPNGTTIVLFNSKLSPDPPKE